MLGHCAHLQSVHPPQQLVGGAAVRLHTRQRRAALLLACRHEWCKTAGSAGTPIPRTCALPEGRAPTQIPTILTLPLTPRPLDTSMPEAPPSPLLTHSPHPHTHPSTTHPAVPPPARRSWPGRSGWRRPAAVAALQRAALPGTCRGGLEEPEIKGQAVRGWQPCCTAPDAQHPSASPTRCRHP